MVFLVNEMTDPIVRLIGDGASWLAEITIGSIIVKMVLSVLLGGCVGIERAAKRHAAGLRTYILVSIGACVAMMTNQFLCAYYGSGDAARLAAQVISGIGFLGAGTILISSRSRIKGLTTAAGLWACACVGIAIGAGYYTLALIGTAFIILVLTFLPRFEYYVRDHAKYIEYHVEFKEKDGVRQFIEVARKAGMIVQSSEFNEAFSGQSVYSYSFILEKGQNDKRNHKEIKEAFMTLPYIEFIEELY